MSFPRVIVDNHIICVCFAILDIWDDFVDKALKSSSSIFHTRGHDFVLVIPCGVTKAEISLVRSFNGTCQNPLGR